MVIPQIVIGGLCAGVNLAAAILTLRALAQPHVAEFVDVVMHDGSLEFRLEEVSVPHGSPLDGRTLRDARIRARTGALVLALRNEAGEFMTNPSPDVKIHAGHILIAIGTGSQLAALSESIRS